MLEDPALKVLEAIPAVPKHVPVDIGTSRPLQSKLITATETLPTVLPLTTTPVLGLGTGAANAIPLPLQQWPWMLSLYAQRYVVGKTVVPAIVDGTPSATACAVPVFASVASVATSVVAHSVSAAAQIMRSLSR